MNELLFTVNRRPDPVILRWPVPAGAFRHSRRQPAVRKAGSSEPLKGHKRQPLHALLFVRAMDGVKSRLTLCHHSERKLSELTSWRNERQQSLHDIPASKQRFPFLQPFQTSFIRTAVKAIRHAIASDIRGTLATFTSALGTGVGRNANDLQRGESL